MSLGSSLTATLGLNISKFRKGLADASASATTWRKGLQKNLGEMGGGNLAGLLGVAGLMQGFSAATREAQELRKAARETGAPLSANVEAAARLADNLDKAKASAIGLVTQGLGVAQGIIDKMALGGYAFFSGQSVKDLEEFGKEKDAQAEKSARDEIQRNKILAIEKQITDEIRKSSEEGASDPEKKAAAIAMAQKHLNESNDPARTEIERAESQLSFERELSTIKKINTAITQKEKEAAEKIAGLRREQTKLSLDDAGIQKILHDEVAAALAESVDLTKTKEERTAALVKSEELALELMQHQVDVEKRHTQAVDKTRDAEEKKTKELKKQLNAQRDQSKEIEKGIAAARRASLLPSLAEVASGERDIGKGAKQSATALTSARSEEQRLADQAQRLFEAEKDPHASAFTKSRLRKERDTINAKRKGVAGRIGALEGSLSGRATGIGNDIALEQLTELAAIRTAAEDTAKALEKKEIKE